MKWPNLKHLHYLVILYQEQHFNRAAQRCHVNQSTLSIAIQNLEEQLNGQLLERDHKTFIFTSFGLEIVERSRVLLQQSSEMMDYALSAGNWQAGNLKLGVIPTIAPFIFEKIITTISSELPRVNLQLQEDTTGSLLKQLNDGVLDLLILALPFETPGCKQLVVGHDPFHLVAHKDILQQLPDPSEISSLPKNSIFLLQAEHCMTGHAVSACGLKHAEQVSALAASSIHTLVKLAACKMGVTFLPGMAVSENIVSGLPLKVLEPENTAFREVGLVWRSGTTRMQLFRKIAELISPIMPIPKLS